MACSRTGPLALVGLAKRHAGSYLQDGRRAVLCNGVVLAARSWEDGFHLFEVRDAFASRAVRVRDGVASGDVRDVRHVGGFSSSILGGTA